MATAVPVDAPLHRLTREEFDRIVDTGALDGLALELIDGYLVDLEDRMTQSKEHAELVQRLLAWFAPKAELLRIQSPLDLGGPLMPEPDVALAHPASDSHPHTALIVVEVAKRSLAHDRRKAALYAKAEVDRYWIADLNRREVTEHVDPTPDGYVTVRVLRGDDPLEPPLDLPSRTVADLFAAALDG